MITTICFDLDGTLVDSELVILKSFDYVFKKYIKEAVRDLNDYRIFMGPPLVETFGIYTKDEKLINEMIKCFVDYYKTIEFDIIKLFPTVYDTLEKLQEKGYNICLITSKFMTSANPSLTHLNIKKFFNDFIALDRQEKAKPDPFPINLCAKDYGIKIENIIMVGDNYVDIKCGKNAGCKTVLVSYNPWFKDSLKAKPTYVINQLDELLVILNKINGGKRNVHIL